MSTIYCVICDEEKPADGAGRTLAGDPICADCLPPEPDDVDTDDYVPTYTVRGVTMTDADL